ncbi:hypothetical protein [Paenibacillus sp.]|uniref:hypothetical protein n=1 Tax=Paenibacillus sp. TaxID=58172 RepID=UPI002D3FFCBC|nr:hypothetical protein [Paenibacillus sp.]HZG55175.1 hypothetical protein [Paenibacillus sp.]
MMEQWFTFARISELSLLLIWWYAAFAASRLVRAPVRSALRRRAGRVAGWIVVGTTLVGVKTVIDAALWTAGMGAWQGPRALPWLAVAALALVAAFRSHPRLLSVSRYEYDRFKAERTAATEPQTIMPIQSTTVCIAVGCCWSWFGPGVLLPAAAALLLGGLWALQRYRHAAARLDEWTRPKPLHRRLRMQAERMLAFGRSNS